MGNVSLSKAARSSGLGALAITATLVFLFGPLITAAAEPSSAAVGFDVIRLAGWLLSTIALGVLFIVAGRIISGSRWLGILIDDRNRLSLSRLQLIMWSVLILATLYTTLSSNGVRALHLLSGKSAAEVTKMLAAALNVNIDWNLVGLMGASVASFVASPIALQSKTNQAPDTGTLTQASDYMAAAQGLSAKPDSTGTLLTKASQADARLSDLIKGEDIGNANAVDITRLQMLVMTIIVYISYAIVVANTLLLSGAELNDLPAISQTLLALILVSHGGYIGGKLLPSSGSLQPDSLKQLAAATQLNQRAADLVRDGVAKLATTTDPATRLALQNIVDQARSAAASSAGLPGQVGSGSLADPSVLTRLDGVLTTLTQSLHATDPNGPVAASKTAPSPLVVAALQRKLAPTYGNVVPTGMVDSTTSDAVTKFLASLKITPDRLDPKPYRFFEEVLSLCP